MTYILLNRLKSLLSSNVTKPSIDAEVINPTEQNFQKIQLGLSDGTKDIKVGSITAATTDAGALSVDSIDLNGNIDASSQATNISLIDNNASALDIKEATNSYLKFDTTNGAEKVSVGKTLDINANIDVATQATGISVLDNNSTALQIKEASNAYLTIDTTNGSERVLASKIIEADGGINLDGNLDASTQATTISIKDNEASALDIAEGANSYIKCTTTNGSESVTVSKLLNIPHGTRTGTYSLSDDTATSFTPEEVVNFIVFGGNQTGNSGIALLRVGATTFADSLVAGTNVVFTTGALSGTTGTDGKLTISSHTDGKIYIENRRGATIGGIYTIIAN